MQIAEDGSTAGVLAGKRVFRSSRVTSFDPMRNALIEHLVVRAKSDVIYPALFEFLVTAAADSVTVTKASLFLPAFYSTGGLRLIETNQLLVGNVIERLRTAQLSLTFDDEERDFALVGMQHFRQLQAIEITMVGLVFSGVSDEICPRGEQTRQRGGGEMP